MIKFQIMADMIYDDGLLAITRNHSGMFPASSILL
jgi:hypothetical protein